MSAMFQLIGDGGHALAAALFAALTIYILRGHVATVERNFLCAAVLLTAFWALHIAFNGIARPLSGLSENLRNGAWLLFMFVMLRRGEGRRADHPVSITVLYAILGGLLLIQTMADIAPRQTTKASFETLVTLSLSLRMMFAAGVLVLVHHLYTISAPEGRARIALLMAGLAAMWTYDLNLYTLALLSRGSFAELYALRGMGMAMLALVMGLGTRGGGEWRLHVSRTVAFRSFSLVAVSLYLIAMALVVAAIEWLAGPHARMVEIGLFFTMLVAAMVTLPSRRFRALLKMKVSKHFFQHRYDYRAEWIRFIDTIGTPGANHSTLYERAVKAVADITDSSSGLLLLPCDGGALAVESVWNWSELTIPAQAIDPYDTAVIEREGSIIDLDQWRSGGGPALSMPWMCADRSTWALVPLIHFNRLAGVILLGRPQVDRRIDWEDHDMLRAAGRQVASYISEAQGQQSLEDARRFDEFNRRFAFIIHDVKNLVSQLSLLARNAERHAENPEFRSDMILTLRESVGKMNELLARLSQHNKARPADPRPIDVQPIAKAIAAACRRQLFVQVIGDAPYALADPQRVEQILAQLVQNAIDASDPDDVVLVQIDADAHAVKIKVTDQGCGMSADFIRRDLFKPFASSKPGGFGIGAFEARELAHSMGGRIDVESRPGEGSSFTLSLPLAEASGTRSSLEERAA